jgi:hypothetical protein
MYHYQGLNDVRRWVICTLLVACAVFFGTTALAQGEIKPRILILFDTSGSMARDIGVYDPVEGENISNSTNGDGSGDDFADWTTQCCAGAGGSRMFIAKEAMREMILTTGDIEFALMKFPQRYVEDLDSCPDYTDDPMANDDLFDIYGSQCAAKHYKYNQGNPKHFDELRYYLSEADEVPQSAADCDFPRNFSETNESYWLCEGFGLDSSAEIWLYWALC